MITSLAHRRLEGELMDDPAIDSQAHQTALRGLRRINLMSRTVSVLWPRIARIAERKRGSLLLLDVATGGGDVAIALARRAQHQGLDLRVEGCDISSTALQFAARETSRVRAPVRFFPLDAVSEPVPAHYDIIISTLFLHHLDTQQIVMLLKALAARTDHLLISDLLRNRTGYALAYLGTRLLSSSKVVHEDGLRSVRAALTLPEARALAGQAGLQDARFERHWPSRFLMSWSRALAPAGTPSA